MVSIYIDAEFDAVKENNKFHQMMISFGAIFERDGEIKTFYSEVKPKGFKALTNVVRRITKLKNEDIRKAPSFPEAMQKFLDWIELKENEVCRLYSLGPDDQRTILQECERYGFSDNLFKDKQINLDTSKTSELSISKYKESIFTKIKNWLKQIKK